MKLFRCSFFLLLLTLSVQAQNPLLIPDTLSGTTFNLSAQTGSRIFFPPNVTPTYAYNGNFLGPTLIMNKWDSVTLNVTNNLTANTTVHWHGLHLPAVCDGGPHSIITPGATWSPVFRVLNDAGTFWYHPHGDMTTELQVTRGLGGLIIVRDSAEAALTLPRTYGVDDFPLIVQSKSFDVLYQLAPYTVDDSIMMVNGTIDPYLQVPQQMVRLRLLNATANRVYNFGLSNDSSFYLIGTDGGLLEQPVSLNRIILSPGERVEILLDFSVYAVSQSVNMISYASELPNGYMGADSVGNAQYEIPDYYNNPLNGADFNIVRFDVIAPTANPVLSVPSTLVNLNPWLESQATVNRDILITPDSSIVGPVALVEGPFFMNGSTFDMDSINEIVYINDIEVWTLINQTMVAHPFHIHDVQFYVLDINGNPPPAELSGQKDVVTVEPFDTVRFITKFEHFADTSTPFMYHCHLLHHEDEGMMGSFLVVDTNALAVQEHQTVPAFNIFPNPATDKIVLEFSQQSSVADRTISVHDAMGKSILIVQHANQNVVTIDVRNLTSGVYFIRVVQDGAVVTKKLVVNHAQK